MTLPNLPSAGNYWYHQLLLYDKLCIPVPRLTALVFRQPPGKHSIATQYTFCLNTTKEPHHTVSTWTYSSLRTYHWQCRYSLLATYVTWNITHFTEKFQVCFKFGMWCLVVLLTGTAGAQVKLSLCTQWQYIQGIWVDSGLQHEVSHMQYTYAEHPNHTKNTNKYDVLILLTLKKYGTSSF
jgi:hypothetical protein